MHYEVEKYLPQSMSRYCHLMNINSPSNSKDPESYWFLSLRFLEHFFLGAFLGKNCI